MRPLACRPVLRHARSRPATFGDLGDPESDVSKLVAEREGYALMPEMGYKPVNRYLPPRPAPGWQGEIILRETTATRSTS